MRRDGADFHEIGAAIGRTAHRVREKVRYMALTPDQRDARRNACNRRRSGKHYFTEASSAMRCSDEMLADRNARCIAALSLTAQLMGDPPRGWSALEGKTGMS